MPINPHRGPFDDRNRRTSWYGIVLRIVPGDSSLLVEVEMAPDSGGAPDTGSARSLGTVGPYPRQGGIFVHRQPNDGATRWYRVRHVGAHVNPGTFTGWLSGVPAYLDTATIETMATEQATTHPIKREIPLDDGDYNVSSSTSNGRKVRETVLDSRDLAINTMFGKTADDLDDANDGVTYGRPRQTGLTGGEIDFSKNGVINRHASHVQRGSADSTTLQDIVQNLSANGDAAAFMEDSRGTAINVHFAKTTDDLDDANDGTTYKKVIGVSSNQITPSSVTGRSRCKVGFGGGNQTIPTAAETIVLWTTELYDIGGLHDTAVNTGRITVPAGGDTRPWLLTANIQWDNTTGGASRLRIVKNGSTEIARAIDQNFADATLGQGLTQSIVGIDSDPAVGDYYEVRATHTKGSDRTINRNASSYSAIHLW